MDMLYYFILAIVVGWITTDVMRNRASLFFNLLLSLVGGFLAGFFLTPYFNIKTIEAPFNLKTLAVTLLGSIVLVVIFNLSRPNRSNW